MDKYGYRLCYWNWDKKVTFKFNGEQDSESLRENLKEFLLACSWTPEQVEDILGVDNETM